MSLPNPYTALAGLLLVVGVGLGVYLWGRGDGRDAQREEDAAIVQAKSEALRKAAARLNADAALFRAIDTQTKADAEAAAELLATSQKFAEEAEREYQALQDQIEELNRQAARERATCSIAEQRICGSPLL